MNARSDMNARDVIARSDATFDGRDFDSLGRADKERYLERAQRGLSALASSPEALREELARALLPNHTINIKPGGWGTDPSPVFIDDKHTKTPAPD